MDVYKELTKNHKKYIKMVLNFGNTNPEDIVQDVYLQILEDNPTLDDARANQEYKDLPTCQRILGKDGINDVYMWILLRKAHQKSIGKLDTFRIGEGFEIESNEDIEQYNESVGKVFDKVMTLLDDMYWFHKKLFLIYISDKESRHNREGLGLSISDLSKQTGLSIRTVNNTITRCRELLEQELGEDYQDIINGDYDLIK